MNTDAVANLRQGKMVSGMLAELEAWLIAEGAWLGPLSALVAVAVVVVAILKWPFSKDKPTQLAPDTIEQLKPPQTKDGPTLTVSEFVRLRRELKADLEQELAEAVDAEKTQLRARIAELESQIANPEEALAKAQKRIKDLEALLDREANQIGGDRIADAKSAMEQGDSSLADDIFAEIEARNELANQEPARAAYGRGEIAEAEVRWHDAYDHYKRAAGLGGDLDHLQAYARMTWRLQKGDEAVALHRQLVDAVKSASGEQSLEYATHLNNLAIVVKAQGRYAEAEVLYREALEIDRSTIGEGHPDYAIHLNNLAAVVEAQGRYAEAEVLYREALGIDCATIGEGHPSYAIRLNNLAGVVEAQGRYAEAEALYREALEIDRATIGEGHPDYAIDLNNLAGLLAKTDRSDDARALFKQALEICERTLPADHPYIASVKASITALDGPT